MKRVGFLLLSAMLLAAFGCTKPQNSANISGALSETGSKAVVADTTRQTEFGQTDSGLLYPAATMKKLYRIVDSLNLRFRTCERTRTYRSLRQGKANYLSLEGKAARKAYSLIRQRVSWADIVGKYPKALLETNLLVMEETSHRKKSPATVSIWSMGLGERHGHSIELTAPTTSPTGYWAVEYRPKSEYNEEKLEAFWILQPLTTMPLAPRYAQMVQYADCMIDTSVQIFRDYPWGRGRENDTLINPAIGAAMSFLNAYTQRPVAPPHFYEDTVGWDIYYKKLHVWDSLRVSRLDALPDQAKLRQLLQTAADSALRYGHSSDELEEYVTRYLSPKIALELKRSRRVVGFCSMDDRPRRHALAIAKLSAETVNWETFLRAHLDILNDRFERASDGSYAWDQRQTYLRELEVLNIDVLDLLLGITLKMDNPGRRHYYGSIRRLGRALAETRTPEVVESRLTQMIADSMLDDFNRVEIYYLYCHYQGNRTPEAEYPQARKRMNAASKLLPAYLAAYAQVEE